MYIVFSVGSSVDEYLNQFCVLTIVIVNIMSGLRILWLHAQEWSQGSHILRQILHILCHIHNIGLNV